MARKSKILVVDDEEVLLALFQKLLGQNCEVKTASNAQEALGFIKISSDFDIIFLDIVLPGISGPEIMPQIKRYCPQARIIMMTGYPLEEVRDDAMEAGAFKFLVKPLSTTDIIKAIANVPTTIDAARMWSSGLTKK